MVCYVDDVLLGLDGWKEHQQVLLCALKVLHDHDWIVSPKKGQWGKREIEYLGTLITRKRMQPSNGLLQKISDIK